MNKLNKKKNFGKNLSQTTYNKSNAKKENNEQDSLSTTNKVYRSKLNTKKRNSDLMRYAYEALQTSSMFKDNTNKTIQNGYNGQVAALGVAIAMSGLRPALAIYYQDKPDSSTQRRINRREILNVIARMITKDTDEFGIFNTAEDLFTYAMRDTDLKSLKREVTDCSIALKQVVRTYKFE